jgi:serine/threonine protein kinase
MTQLLSLIYVEIFETICVGSVLIRDIKGANILVDPNGQIKLADFGMAKHVRAFIRCLHVYYATSLGLDNLTRVKNLCLNYYVMVSNIAYLGYFADNWADSSIFF